MYNGTSLNLTTTVKIRSKLRRYLLFCVELFNDAYSLPAARSSLDGAVSPCTQQLAVAAILT